MSVNVVTGGAGFVAANLIPRLLERGVEVVAIDNLSRGSREYWSTLSGQSGFRASVVDCTDFDAFRDAVASIKGDITDVWHLAANSDIPAGVADPSIDLNGTFLTTFNTLRVMRDLGIPNLRFSSSSAIYGNLGEIAIHEDVGPLEPISNYGAMKLASEAQIRAAVEAFLPRADIFRFPNVVGVPATHGVMLDFIRKLEATPDHLEVLGDGTQRKAYVHVDELVDAMLFIVDNARERYNVFNVGPADDGIRVSEIAELVRDHVAPDAVIRFGNEGRGWVGDVPRFRYATGRLHTLGWRPSLDSHGAVGKAVVQIARQEADRRAGQA